MFQELHQMHYAASEPDTWCICYHLASHHCHMPTMCRNPGEGRGGLQAVCHGVVANNNTAGTYSDASQDHGAREGRYAIQSAKD